MSAPMTTVEHALLNAGLIHKITNSERIWRVIKESMPAGITYRALARRLQGISPGTLSSTLNSMRARGMIYCRSTKPPVGVIRSYVLEYMTDMETYQHVPHVPRRKQDAPAKAPRVSTTAAVASTRQSAIPESTMELYGENYMTLVNSWIKAGGNPAVLSSMPLSVFLVNCARNGMKLSVTNQGERA